MIQRGQTLEAQLLDWFGPPEVRSLDADGRAHLAWNLPEGTLQVQLAADGTVTSYAARRSPSDESGRRRGYDDGQIARIQRGETTGPELVESFGTPDFQNVESDGRGTLAWNFEAQNDGEVGHSGELKVKLAPDGKVEDYSARRGLR